MMSDNIWILGRIISRNLGCRQYEGDLLRYLSNEGNLSFLVLFTEQNYHLHLGLGSLLGKLHLVHKVVACSTRNITRLSFDV